MLASTHVHTFSNKTVLITLRTRAHARALDFVFSTLHTHPRQLMLLLCWNKRNNALIHARASIQFFLSFFSIKNILFHANLSTIQHITYTNIEIHEWMNDVWINASKQHKTSTNIHIQSEKYKAMKKKSDLGIWIFPSWRKKQKKNHHKN